MVEIEGRAQTVPDQRKLLCSGQALAGHVSDDECVKLLVQRKDIVEVAADRGFVESRTREAANRQAEDMFGYGGLERLLKLLRDSPLSASDARRVQGRAR